MDTHHQHPRVPAATPQSGTPQPGTAQPGTSQPGTARPGTARAGTARAVGTSAAEETPAAAPLGPAPPAPPEPRRRSAGRDLPAAVGVGLGLGALLLGSLLVYKDLFLLLVVVAVVVAVLEVSSALAPRGTHVPRVPVVVGSVLVVGGAWALGPEGLFVGYGLTCLAVVVWRVAEGLDGAVRDVTAGVLAVSYLPLLAGFAALMLAADDGAGRVLVFVAAVIASDIGGYAAGVLAGRHPMAPSVSPKKSWEGLAGSVLLAGVVGTGCVVWLLGGPWWVGLALGAATGVTATFGDLAESMLKRDLGIKDMGSVLPGHGGVMDRMDSLVISAPVVWLVLSALVPAT